VTDPEKSEGGEGTLEDPAELSFEKALEELEGAIEKLEDGSLTLDEQVAVYERGTQLVQACREKLDGAAARIEKVIGSEEGDAAVEPFEEPDEDA
jgi:exodeoxyribonuclease VII small subunit